LSSGLKGVGIRRRDQVRGSRCAKPSRNHRGGGHRGLVGGVCIWSYEAIVSVWAQHQMPLIGIPGNATGLVFGKEVQQAPGSFWYLLGTAECGAMSSSPRSWRRMSSVKARSPAPARSGRSRSCGAPERSLRPSDLAASPPGTTSSPETSSPPAASSLRWPTGTD
jgi:hypothetical protein